MAVVRREGAGVVLGAGGPVVPSCEDAARM